MHTITESYLGVEDTVEEEDEESQEADESSKEVLIELHVLVDCQKTKDPGDAQQRQENAC